MQQLEQGRLVGRKFLQRLAVDPRNNAGDQPARLADLDDGDKCAILIQSGERSAQSLPRRRPGSFGCGMGHILSVVFSDDHALSSPLAP
jgi:hypothetical protein